MTDMLILNVDDIVTDAVGDRGKVRKVGHPKVKNAQTFIFADPAAAGPTFEVGPATVLVEWETLNGKPAFMQASWEDVGDLTLVPAA
ncbi:hypothetical protein O6V14_04545 [Sphingomonas faeni]|uniref:hypothetical protein n=1 Tax=Sphingomonas faeni TaxID=185950 RepID=UPI0033607AD1